MLRNAISLCENNFYGRIHRRCLSNPSLNVTNPATNVRNKIHEKTYKKKVYYRYGEDKKESRSSHRLPETDKFKRSPSGLQQFKPSIPMSAFRKFGTTFEYSRLHRKDLIQRAAILALQAESMQKLHGLENSEAVLLDDVHRFLLLAHPNCRSHLAAVNAHAKTLSRLSRKPPSDILLLAQHPENPKLELKEYLRNIREYNSTLACWIDVQLSRSGDVPAMVQHLRKERELSRRLVGLNRGIFVQDRSIYSSLMNTAAKNRDWSSIRALFGFMAEDGLPGSVPCGVAALECLGRMLGTPATEGADKIQRVKNLVELILRTCKMNVSQLEQHLMRMCVTNSDDRFYIVKVIQLVHSEFNYLPYPITGQDGDGYKHAVLKGFHDLQHSAENPFHGVLSQDDAVKGFEQQFSWERGLEVEIPPIVQGGHTAGVQKVHGETKKVLMRVLDKMRSQWREELTAGFKNMLDNVRRRYSGHKTIGVLPFLTLFPVDHYVTVMMQEIDRLAQETSFGHLPQDAVYKRLSGILEQHYKLAQLDPHVQKYRDLYTNFLKRYGADEDVHQHQRLKFLAAAQQEDAWEAVRSDQPSWSSHIRWVLGFELYDVMFSCLKFVPAGASRQKQPVVVQVVVETEEEPMTVIRLHPELLKFLAQVTEFPLKFPAFELPMLCPPLPWIWIQHAGYLLSDCRAGQFIRQSERSVSRTALETDDGLMSMRLSRRLAPSLDSLNILAACPWKVNPQVLDIALDVFRAGGDLDLAMPLAEKKFLQEWQKKQAPAMNRRDLRRQRSELRKEKQENFSLWCTELYRLSIAQHLRDQVFWLPHSMDFRGRVYPVPPHFQHMGGDISRALLRFARGKPLGPRGLHWLKLHLINLTGLAKRSSLKERVELADELLPEVMDSAENPLDGRGWWKNDEDPWQTLSCCMEIAAALKSSDHRDYVSHFPVHQDGSCNGLQHYAAMGRDALGAATVNLTPQERPSDVYSDVVELVEEQRKQDAAQGLAVAQVLEGFVIRKVIKKSVMTTVYGVTEYGARQQIRKQLKMVDFPREHLGPACQYLAKHTLGSIGKIFTSSRDIQIWFGHLARRLVRVRGVPVRWDTPLGLPVRQPYIQFGKRHNLPDPVKQRNAFAPNYVHSLDGTHMMLTALHCHRLGLTFVSVHDCFWTHAADVDAMNEVTREQFVALHNQPLLEQLSKSLDHRYCFRDKEMDHMSPAMRADRVKFNQLLRSPPDRGDFDLDLVRQSTYFFS